ncbi:unnamed protein product [Vicia faba]|uniref:Uncharacterized protein n=1 Tax=Vicia faba TaxID=3906 RepID=A0AAV0YWX5_VICFA|nr:unnamed protein product [Vicia faba]
MIVLVNVPKKKYKNVDFKKNKTTEKVSLYDKDTFVQVNADKLVDYVNKDKEANDVDTTPTENIVESIKININLNVEPHVETSGEPSSEPHVEPPTEPNTKPIVDIHVFDTF